MEFENLDLIELVKLLIKYWESDYHTFPTILHRDDSSNQFSYDIISEDITEDNVTISYSDGTALPMWLIKSDGWILKI